MCKGDIWRTPGGGGALFDALQVPNQKNTSHLSDFMTFLTSRPEPGEICNFIVLTWPTPDVIQQSAIGHVSNDGNIAFLGWFGYEAKINQAFGATTIWDDIPSSVAVRNRKMLVLANREAVQEQFPHVAKAMPDLNSIMASPLKSHSTSHGVCVVSSDKPLMHEQESSAVLNDYCLALSLYFSTMRNDQSRSSDPSAIQKSPHQSEIPQRHTLAPSQLSERQLAVLRYLAEGYTNRQMALRMGFSESTVRQETMAIYAFFGVRGRKEAVGAALNRGIVTHKDDDEGLAI